MQNAYETFRDPIHLEYEKTGGDLTEDRQFATTLAKGLEILRCFTPVKPLLSNAELSELTKLSRPTISRFTYTLVKLGYLRVDAPTGRYRLAPGVVSLGYPLLASIPLRQIARAGMNHLADTAKVSVSMGVRDRLSIVYVETSRSPGSWAAQLSDIGLRYPIATTAIGHAYVGACEPAAREAILNEIKVRMPQAWAKWSDKLCHAHQELAHKGFCGGYGDQHPDYFAVGAPIGRTIDGELIVFNCVAPIASITKERFENSIGPQLVSMLENIRGAARAFY